MGAGTLISVEEYLHTAYSPDREYRDGIVLERNVGNRRHALLQQRLASYIGRRRRSWNVEVYTELRIRARAGWYPIPDVCVYQLPMPDGDPPEVMPFLWIEILSPEDRMVDVWQKAGELIRCGAAYVWIIDPTTLESELRSASTVTAISDKTLRLDGGAIEIPLLDVIEE